MWRIVWRQRNDIAKAMSANKDSNKILKQPRIEHWRCAVCLYRVGLGCVRIGRMLRKDKAQVARWVRFAGVSDAGRQNGIRGNKANAMKWAQSAETIAKRAQKRLDDASMLNRRKENGTPAFSDLPLFNHASAIKKRIFARQWSRKNIKRICQRIKHRCRTDPAFKVLKNQRMRLWQVLKRNPKAGTTLKLIGCTKEHLVRHLESKWKPGMNWSNYGLHGWHVDHIRPCDSFDLSDPKQQAECFHYTNLQPLWSFENWAKNNRWEPSRRPLSPSGDESPNSIRDR
jgi:hypothetical protein